MGRQWYVGRHDCIATDGSNNEQRLASALLKASIVVAVYAMTTIVHAAVQPREMYSSAVTIAPRHLAATTADTLTSPPQADLTAADEHVATAVVAVSQPSSIIPQQAAATAIGTRIFQPGEASSVSALHEAKALANAVTQSRGGDSSAATTVRRQVAAATTITSTLPSVAV